MKHPFSLGLGIALGLGGGWLWAALMRVPTEAAAPARQPPVAPAPAEPSTSPSPPSASQVVSAAVVTRAPDVAPTIDLPPSSASPVAPRFVQAALRSRFVEAFEEIETEGRIVRVDCAELPCIVFGEVTEADDLDNLVSSEAFAPHARDVLVQHQSEEAEDRYLFAVALFESPTDPRERARIEARVQARIRMGGSFRGR